MAEYTVQELCESRGGRPGLPVPNSPYGLYGRKATLNSPNRGNEWKYMLLVTLNTWSGTQHDKYAYGTLLFIGVPDWSAAFVDCSVDLHCDLAFDLSARRDPSSLGTSPMSVLCPVSLSISWRTVACLIKNDPLSAFRPSAGCGQWTDCVRFSVFSSSALCWKCLFVTSINTQVVRLSRWSCRS